MSYDYRLLHVQLADRVCWATIDAPPLNVMVVDLFRELGRFAEQVAADPAVGAVVLQSADPDFFIAHFDVEAILGFPVDGPAERPERLGGFHRMCELFRTMPKATLAKIAGRVGGGGSELCSNMDMRFGLVGKTIVNQMEVPIGILPGGSGTQRLPVLLGQGRAMEVILGGIDLDAVTAERWGYLNRAFETIEDLNDYVDGLARRIASFPPPAVAAAKAAVVAGLGDPTDGLNEEQFLFQQLLRTPEAGPAMRRFLDAGGQTREGEAMVAELSGSINDPARATSSDPTA